MFDREILSVRPCGTNLTLCFFLRMEDIMEDGDVQLGWGYRAVTNPI